MAIEGVNTNTAASYQTTPVNKTNINSDEATTDFVSTEKIVSINSESREAIKNLTDLGKLVYNSEEEEDQQKNENINEALRKAVDTINKQLVHTECQFGFHDATNRIMIKIIDKDTKEVLKEFPPEKTLEMIAKTWELAGILVDEKL